MGDWINLREYIANKKAVINMKNNDFQSFRWCITRACNPMKNPERVTNILKKQEWKINWGKRSLNIYEKIDYLERKNDISINLYYDNGYEIIPALFTNKNKKNHINLLYVHNGLGENSILITDCFKYHFALIKNLSRLLSYQLTDHKSKMYFCKFCSKHSNNERII